YKIVPWQRISESLGLRAGAPHDPTGLLALDTVTVMPTVETAPVFSFGDAADDPVIWVHPTDVAHSVVIGTQKQRGINVYDLEGNLLQAREDGRINNADIRYGFLLDGEPADIVTGSNRSTDSIGIWMVDRPTRTLVDVADGVIPTGMADPYGLCMYRSPGTGQYHVIVNDTDGLVRQWRLFDSGAGRVGAELVREFSVGSQTEGCVADDETGDLYIGEENRGIWKYSAEPDSGSERTLVDGIEDGNLTADVEGLAIYYSGNGEGYLIASNQGADNYAVYERQGDNAFLGHFFVVADEASGIDGASETDGLDVTSANLGATFPNGVLVVQDGRNITPKARQNYKLIPWERIAEAMGLSIHHGYDPRAEPGT
ncbi:MAG: phytase, partial [Proteobacteria bacterium]|nr:phytase [Pseudomonadota bacterium]